MKKGKSSEKLQKINTNKKKIYIVLLRLFPRDVFWIMKNS